MICEQVQKMAMIEINAYSS